MGLIEKETGLLQFTGLIDGDQWIHYSWKENKLPSSWLTFIAFPLWEGKESKLVQYFYMLDFHAYTVFQGFTTQFDHMLTIYPDL